MSPRVDAGTVEILLVEDNPGDQRLALEGLKEGTVHRRVSVVSDGDEALRFLTRRPPFVDAPRPNLVLLDLNLPGKSGREVLSAMKADPVLRSIPVVVMSGSAAAFDVNEAYRLQAACYVQKPVGLDALLELMRLIDGFWLATAQLPGDG